MLNFQTIRTRPRIFQQLTGLTLAAFETLLTGFERAYDDDRQQRDRQRPTPRQHRPGGGAKGALPTPADRLVFVLFYFRQYPTQETLAFLFGFSQGQACQWIHRLTPIVARALGSQLHLPARRPAPLEEVLRASPSLEFLIDGTERPIRRPRDGQRRRDDSSGKKKRHTRKNIVITDRATGKVVCQSRNYRKRPCPRCRHRSYRDGLARRTLHDLGNPLTGRPRDIVLIDSPHDCTRCRKYFNADMTDLADPGSHSTRRVIDSAVRFVIEDGLPSRSASWTLWREHRVFVPSATIQNWVEAGGEKAARRTDPAHLDWALSDFSGSIAADEL
jgi:hypothetical protein